MPTGYTHKVQDGTITEFRDFAWECARAFGALILMRDEPAGAPIPERFEPDTRHYDGAIERAKKERAELDELTAEQATKEAAAEHRDAVASWEKRRAERNAQKLRYLAMLEKVEAWTPPTSEHHEMKNFMLEQLRSSIDFDCGRSYDTPPEPETGAAWLERKRAEAVRSIAYQVEERHKELARVEGRNRWLAALRKSIGDPRRYPKS
jgi:hypothetical protein